MTDDSSHLVIGIDSVDEAEYRLKYCTLSSFWYGNPLFPAPTNHENPFGTGKPCPAVRNRRPGYSKPRAAERFLMGWCRGGKVDGWARGRADGKAGAGARLAAGLTAGLTTRQALAAGLTAKHCNHNTRAVTGKTLTNKQMTILPVRISGQAKPLIRSV